MLNTSYYELENKITDMIIENKDKIRFIKSYQQGFSFTNYEFRLYLKQRNIFGFRKYITIITDDPIRYSYLSMDIIIPAFIADIGFDDKLEIQNTENNEKLSKILHECYNDRNRLDTIKNLFRILYNNFYKGNKKKW